MTGHSQPLTLALGRVRTALAGATVCLVCPRRRAALVDASYRSLAAALPAMGLESRELFFDDVNDLYTECSEQALRRADVVVKIVHGSQNRSGLVQAVLKSVGARCAGHPVEADVLAQRKSLVKELMRCRGVPTLPFARVRGGDGTGLAAFLAAVSPGPYILKPDDGNASEGIEYLLERGALERAVAARADTCIVEPYVRGRVVTVGVATLGGAPVALPPLEYLLAHDQPIMDASWKRHPRRARATGLPSATCDALMAHAVDLHAAVGARGLSRSDFIVATDGRVFALEINTNIGLGEEHDIAAVFRESGFDYPSVVWAHLGSAVSP